MYDRNYYAQVDDAMTVTRQYRFGAFCMLPQGGF